MRVLAIESSCDESAVAVLDSVRGLLAHEIYSQVELHQKYGGVVPELASRDHVQRLLPLLQQTLRASGGEKIDGIAYTAGPGLVGALLTGAALARSLAYAWQVPAIGIHHLEGHLLAPLLEDERPPLPHLALLVSGGHTMLIDVRAVGTYNVLGETRDDAAGEAFDKSAKLLGLPYPGGPALAALAAGASATPGAVASDSGPCDKPLRFPRPMLDRPGFEFSFSGLKTAVALAARERPLSAPRRAAIAAEAQAAIVETLVVKTLRALETTGHSSLVVAGGVGANRLLREQLRAAVSLRGARVYYPRLEFCTDNAAMIAVAGMLRLQAGECDPLAIAARAQWPIATLRTPGSAPVTGDK